MHPSPIVVNGRLRRLDLWLGTKPLAIAEKPRWVDVRGLSYGTVGSAGADSRVTSPVTLQDRQRELGAKSAYRGGLGSGSEHERPSGIRHDARPWHYTTEPARTSAGDTKKCLLITRSVEGESEVQRAYRKTMRRTTTRTTMYYGFVPTCPEWLYDRDCAALPPSYGLMPAILTPSCPNQG